MDGSRSSLAWEIFLIELSLASGGFFQFVPQNVWFNPLQDRGLNVRGVHSTPIFRPFVSLVSKIFFFKGGFHLVDCHA
jgi:hypothetical protein